MIRHAQHAVHNVSTSRSTARPAAKSQAETNPFRNVLDSATVGTNAKPVKLAATVTKPATPTVVLSPPVFEDSPSLTNADGSVAALNWTQFASAATAEEIAAKLGGKVAESKIDGYSTTQRSVEVKGSPNLVNAGIAAQLFAQYGDKPGSLAWQVINRDLGRDPMST